MSGLEIEELASSNFSILTLCFFDILDRTSPGWTVYFPFACAELENRNNPRVSNNTSLQYLIIKPPYVIYFSIS